MLREGRLHSITLVFHKLSPRFTFGVTNYSPTRIHRLLRSLQDRGYALKRPFDPSADDIRAEILLTFDDGYHHLMDILPRLMEVFGIRPVVFVPTDYIGRENSWDYSSVFRTDRHLSEPEIRRLADMGAVIGSHGHRHCDLTSMTARALETELRESRFRLEDIVGGRISLISYPFGRVSERVLDMAKQVGYRVGYTMKYPTAEDLPLATGRIAVYGYDTTLAVLQKVAHGPLFALERLKAGITNRLSSGSELWRRLWNRSK